jgi:hypothetical protein
MYITKDPGSWQQYVKRADNIGVPLHELAKKYTMESNMYVQQMLMEAQQQQQQIEQNTTAVGGIAPTPSITPSVTPSVTATPSITPTISVTPSITPTITLTPTPSTSQSAYKTYNYVISGTDIALATGNTGGNAQYNGKVVVVVTNGYNCGNTTPRTFTVALTAGSYISWVCSPTGVTPVIGYYANDVLITAGLVSTQTLSGACPC